MRQPTDAERERLAILLEEMGEATQVIGKILRHGWEPTHNEIKYNNRADLQAELGDVHAAVLRLCNANDVSYTAIHARAEKKLAVGGTLLRSQR